MDNNLLCLSSRSFFNEKNDCVVRAISIALNIPYSEAHFLCEKRGRKPKKGFHPYTAFKINRYGKKKTAIYKGVRISLRKVGKHMPTIPTFVKKHPVGRFICVKRNHAFAIIDGKVYGQLLDNSRIEYYLNITKHDSTSGQQKLANAKTVCEETQSVEAGSEQLDNKE